MVWHAKGPIPLFRGIWRCQQLELSACFKPCDFFPPCPLVGRTTFLTRFFSAGQRGSYATPFFGFQYPKYFWNRNQRRPCDRFCNGGFSTQHDCVLLRTSGDEGCAGIHRGTVFNQYHTHQEESSRFSQKFTVAYQFFLLIFRFWILLRIDFQNIHCAFFPSRGIEPNLLIFFEEKITCFDVPPFFTTILVLVYLYIVCHPVPHNWISLHN